MTDFGKKVHNRLRDFSDKNRTFKRVYLEYRHMQFTFIGLCVNARRKRRQSGKKTIYDRLLDYKGIHEGERCFVIATGPSLTMEDLESLGGEYTIAMNSICKLYDQTDWRPTYYAVQDNLVFDKMQDILRQYKEVPVFIADNIKKRYKRDSDWIEFPFDSMYHAYDMKIGKLHTKFSDDAYDIVYDGYSIAYSCLQLAVYMGFKEIYLLGCDCTYLGEKEHFVDSGVEDRNRKNLTPMLFVGYEKAKEFADKNGIKIYNATRGGVLEIFERVNFDDIVKKELYK